MAKQFVVASRSKGIKCVVNITLRKFKGQAPYFSVTGFVYTYGKRGRPALISAGCIHHHIQQVTSRFDDVIALHLADIDGVPSYAVDNSRYFISCGGLVTAKEHLRCTDEELKDLEALVADKAAYSAYIDKHLRPRWQQEAQAVIDKYGLEVELER